MRYLAMIASSLTFMSSAAHAELCDLSLDTDAVSVSVSAANVGPNEVRIEDFAVRVIRTDEPVDNAVPCRAVLTAARVNALADPNLPPYLVLGPGNQRIDVLSGLSGDRTTASDIVIENISHSPQGETLPFRIRVPTEWGLKAGQYTDRLQLSLYDDSGTLRDSTDVTVNVAIPPAVQVRIVGSVSSVTQNAANVDLGTLSSKQETRSDPFGARILSTTPYSVTFLSTNGGSLLNEDGVNRIPYRLYFDGELVDLAGVNLFPRSSHTPASGDASPMLVVVPATRAAAGRYWDNVLITVTAI